MLGIVSDFSILPALKRHLQESASLGYPPQQGDEFNMPFIAWKHFLKKFSWNILY